MKAGLIIAHAGSRIDHDKVYDSRLSKLTVDPDQKEKHFDIIDSLSGGTRWDIPQTSRTLYTEDLVRIRHGLPFVPQFQVYFTSIASSSGRATTGQYSQNKALMVYNAPFKGDEWLEAEADSQYLYIRHKAIRNDIAREKWVTDGGLHKFRVRYFIFNQPTYLIPGGKSQSF